MITVIVRYLIYFHFTNFKTTKMPTSFVSYSKYYFYDKKIHYIPKVHHVYLDGSWMILINPKLVAMLHSFNKLNTIVVNDTIMRPNSVFVDNFD